MNIFYLHPAPRICAEMHNDRHCVKMILEYAQLLSTAHRVLDGEPYYDKTANGRRIKRWRMAWPHMENNLYKATHINHPSNIWVRQSDGNYNWLYVLWRELISEYKFRYMRTHACDRLDPYFTRIPHNIPSGEFTQPTPAMPPEYQTECSMESYRNYYLGAKSHIASWKNREPPEWWNIF